MNMKTLQRHVEKLLRTQGSVDNYFLLEGEREYIVHVPLILDYDKEIQCICAGLKAHAAAKIGKPKSIAQLTEGSLKYLGSDDPKQLKHSRKIDIVLIYLKDLETQCQESIILEIKRLGRRIELLPVQPLDNGDKLVEMKNFLASAFLKGYQYAETLEPQYQQSLIAAHNALLKGQPHLFKELSDALRNPQTQN